MLLNTAIEENSGDGILLDQASAVTMSQIELSNQSPAEFCCEHPNNTKAIYSVMANLICSMLFLYIYIY